MLAHWGRCSNNAVLLVTAKEQLKTSFVQVQFGEMTALEITARVAYCGGYWRRTLSQLATAFNALIPTTDREEMRIKELRERMELHSLCHTGIACFCLQALSFSVGCYWASLNVLLCAYVAPSPVCSFARLVTPLCVEAAAAAVSPLQSSLSLFSAPSLKLVHCLVAGVCERENSGSSV